VIYLTDNGEEGKTVFPLAPPTPTPNPHQQREAANANARTVATDVQWWQAGLDQSMLPHSGMVHEYRLCDASSPAGVRSGSEQFDQVCGTAYTAATALCRAGGSREGREEGSSSNDGSSDSSDSSSYDSSDLGVSVRSRAGDAAMFFNQHDGLGEDIRALHGGCGIGVDATATKIVLAKFIRAVSSYLCLYPHSHLHVDTRMHALSHRHYYHAARCLSGSVALPLNPPLPAHADLTTTGPVSLTVLPPPPHPSPRMLAPPPQAPISAALVAKEEAALQHAQNQRSRGAGDL
jgi:hypothetical protein